MIRVAAAALLLPAAAAAAGAGHVDPVSAVALPLAVILVVAKLGGDVAVRLRQPAVLGELIAGVLLGNLTLVGFSGFEPFESNASLDLLASLGVVVLLFEVGLESTVRQMLQVGWSSLMVAVLGVAAPFALGWLVGAWLLPDRGPYVHAFLGATLTATSVGITARVLQDLRRSQSAEARIILGAAVIDDVLGLVVLAVVAGLIAAADRGQALSAGGILAIVGKAAAFLVGSLVIGVLTTPRVFSFASRLRPPGVLLAAGLSFCFLLSWLSGAIGLAPIVGAFAAGLILEQVHYRDFVGRGEHELEELVRPISQFLAPLFFVLVGMRTDLAPLADPAVLGLAAALIVAAMAGKLGSGLGVVSRGVDRLSVGIGMVPRGEVGLIFANIGLGLAVTGERVVDPTTYAAVVVMVIATTMATPPLLKWSLGRGGAEPRASRTGAPADAPSAPGTTPSAPPSPPRTP